MGKRIKVKCPLCDYETDNVHSLFGHMLSTHCDEAGYFIEPGEEAKEETVYVCEFCGAEFKTKEEVANHIINAHFAELQKLDEEIRKAEEEEKKKKRKSKKPKTERGKEPSP